VFAVFSTQTSGKDIHSGLTQDLLKKGLLSFSDEGHPVVTCAVGDSMGNWRSEVCHIRSAMALSYCQFEPCELTDKN
ncbi:hypothetical protein PFISCL1PPCAC_25159, partial [Pristionchus fissidentatus]